MPYPNAPFSDPSQGQGQQLPPWLNAPPQVAGQGAPGMGPNGPTGIPNDLAGGVPPGGMPQGPGGAPGAPGYQIPNAQAQQALGVGSNKLQLAKLQQQYNLADALRADAKNQMQGRMAGRVYVGPKWWDAAASIGDQYMAGKTMQKADQDLATFQGKQAKAGSGILKSMGLLKDDDNEEKAEA